MKVLIRIDDKFFTANKSENYYKIVSRIPTIVSFEAMDKCVEYNPYVKYNHLGITYVMNYKLAISNKTYFSIDDDEYEKGEEISVVDAEYEYGVSEVEYNTNILFTYEKSEEDIRNWNWVWTNTKKRGHESEDQIHDRLIAECEKIENKRIRDMFADWKITPKHSNVEIKIGDEKFVIEKSNNLYSDLRMFEYLYKQNPNFLKAIKSNHKYANYAIWGIEKKGDEFEFSCCCDTFRMRKNGSIEEL